MSLLVLAVSILSSLPVWNALNLMVTKLYEPCTYCIGFILMSLQGVALRIVIKTRTHYREVLGTIPPSWGIVPGTSWQCVLDFISRLCPNNWSKKALTAIWIPRHCVSGPEKATSAKSSLVRLRNTRWRISIVTLWGCRDVSKQWHLAELPHNLRCRFEEAADLSEERFVWISRLNTSIIHIKNAYRTAKYAGQHIYEGITPNFAESSEETSAHIQTREVLWQISHTPDIKQIRT